MKNQFLLILTLLSNSAMAEPATILNCSGKSEVGAYGEKNFPPGVLTKGQDAEFHVVFDGKKLNVGSMEFVNKPVSPELTDTESFGGVKVTDTVIEAYWQFDNGNLPSKSGIEKESSQYLYSHSSVSIFRLSGEFHYSESFFVKDIKNNWLGKQAKTKLNSGYVMRNVTGTCKKSDKKQLF